MILQSRQCLLYSFVVIHLWNDLLNSAVNAESLTAFQASILPTTRQYCNANVNIYML